MDFTTSQKAAIAKILSDIAKADNHVHEKERQYLIAVGELIDLKESDIRDATELGVFASLGIVSQMRPEQKAALGLMITTMADIDGDFHSTEHFILDKVFKALGI